MPETQQMRKIEWHRPRLNVVQWTLTNEMGERHTYHANRYATFFGAYDGRYRDQFGGAAWTPWHAEDTQVERLLERRFRVRARFTTKTEPIDEGGA